MGIMSTVKKVKQHKVIKSVCGQVVDRGLDSMGWGGWANDRWSCQGKPLG